MTTKKSPDTTESINDAVSSMFQNLLSKAAPKVSREKTDIGIDTFFPPRGQAASVQLVHEAAKICGERIKRVGSLSVKAFDKDDNIARLSCETYEPIDNARNSWWSIACLDADTPEHAAEVVKDLQEANIPAVRLCEIRERMTDENAIRAYEELVNFTYRDRGPKMAGVPPRKLSPQYDPDHIVILYYPSGSEMNRDTLWTNSPKPKGTQTTAPGEDRMATQS
jgi:hypothetical protein